MAHNVAPEGADQRGGQLQTGALTIVDGTVLGVASASPAYSLTATLAVIAGAIGVWSPSALIVGFLPMLGVAVGFYWLNRRMPNCGTSYTWIARTLLPQLGFLTGWVIVAADIIVLISLAGVAASATLTLFGQDPSNKTADLIIGLLWLALMTFIVIRGIRLAARTQWVLLGLEYIIVIAFSVWAIIDVYANHPKGSHTFNWTWLLPWTAPGGASTFIVGVVGAVFLYWGWDTACNVNEETEDSDSVPGLASITSTFLLLLVYVVAASAVVMYLPTKAVAGSSDVLTDMAKGLAGGNKLWYLMVLAVVSSTASCTQTSILPASRVAFAMGRDRVFPGAFAWLQPNWRTPWFGSLVIGVLGGALYVVQLYSSGNVGTAIQNAIAALGLLVSFYYGFTGLAAVWYYRRLLFDNAANLVFAGLFPLAGALGFFYIFYEAARSLTHDQVETAIVAILIGVPMLAISWIRNPGFYRQPLLVAERDQAVTGDTAISAARP